MIYERTIAIIFLLGFTWMACHKEQPEKLNASHLIGKKWKCTQCLNQNQTWEFGDSTEVAYQIYEFSGQAFQTNKFHFVACDDTVHLFNLGTKQFQKWTVTFENDSIVNVHIQGASMQPIQQLKKATW